MIEPINMFEDLRSDAVGAAITKLRSLPVWNKEKHARRKEMDAALEAAGYIKEWSTAQAYHLTYGVGFSYLYQVPENKRGKLIEVRGSLIRIVYTGSDNRSAEFSYAVVSENQRGRSYSMLAEDPSASDLDVRCLYPFAYGEADYLPPVATSAPALSSR